jgi:RHH-type proline utilization regulon transcriptional repressor/proline dehydrogenase/delta 1-pyrroline-5-carboxylate dehydrogenase
MQSLAQYRAAIASRHRIAEEAALAPLLPLARSTSAEQPRVDETTRSLLEALRRQPDAGLVERFMREYALSSGEGIALLSLAEAYLRVPDPHTANLLIQDKVQMGDWAAHGRRAPSAVVNTATFGLILTKALTAPGGGALRGLIPRMGEPVVRKGVAAAMQQMGGQFVLGRTIDEALARARREGAVCSFDMLGEAAHTAADARRYFEAYEGAIEAIGLAASADASLARRHSVSIKLSALHPRYEPGQAERAIPELTAHVVTLARRAKRHGIGLTIDAEEADRLEMSLDIIAAVAADPTLAGWDGLGMAIQAYQKRAMAVIEWADALGRATDRRIQVRLVKGAYWDTEIKHAQEEGLDGYPVYTRKEATDVSYLACARRMLAAENIAPAFATHNALTLASLMTWAGNRDDIEFQRLHGMGEPLYAEALKDGRHQVRVYAPVGGYRDLLAYLVRRLLENGANSSFVHQIGDTSRDIDAIAADPVALIEANGGVRHPLIPMPADLYGAERLNSEGTDLSDRDMLRALESRVVSIAPEDCRAAPLIGGQESAGRPSPVPNPANPDQVVGEVVEATPDQIRDAIDRASRAAPAWAALPVEERAVCLERAADLLEKEKDAFFALAVREAGKCLPDTVAEVREAVDFCRYYAAQARTLLVTHVLPGPTGERNEMQLSGRGVFACISPWNFPLAIFLGQVTAALVAGNAVIAKPAPQTPLIAARAVRLLHRAGVPADVLQLLPGGAEVGAALVADRRISGVAFTGSTGAAKRIARSILDDDRRPIAPLVAETGGINAMIVDSTALPEQVVADVIDSAFRSAGQRCSALRLLCLQEDVADGILEMLKGAMAELQLGDPALASTDVGPLIDETARGRVQDYIDANASRVVASLPTEGVPAGYFVGPTIIRLDAPEQLTQEVFGPVLHVVTWKAGELEALVDRINANGYGLTMGLHSRLASAMDVVRARAKVGNLYVNRSTIGAVVGVQPFGGEGLSGTGFKAGGPHYLLRFVTERAISIDTTSAGGNASLFNLQSDEAVA